MEETFYVLVAATTISESLLKLGGKLSGLVKKRSSARKRMAQEEVVTTIELPSNRRGSF